MKRSAVLPWVWNAGRVALGFLFLLAASGKLRDPVKFMGGMDEYGLVHGWVLPIGAVVMPGIEWLGALMLLLAWRTRAAGMLVGGMLLLFIFAMASAMHRHLELDCSCFDLMGADPVLLVRGPWVRDLALTGLALAFFGLSRDPSPHLGRRPWRALVIVALFAWVSFALLDAGPLAWRTPSGRILGVAVALYLVFDVFAQGWATLPWKGFLRDVLILGPVLWLIFHVLGDGEALLGWGTILRDTCMAVPALLMAVYGPDEF